MVFIPLNYRIWPKRPKIIRPDKELEGARKLAHAVEMVLTEQSSVYSMDDSMIFAEKHQIEPRYRSVDRGGPHSIELIS